MAQVTIAKDVTPLPMNGNGLPADSGQKVKHVMSIESEKVILKKIERHCHTWSNIANAYVLSIIVFGVSAVSTSVLVSIYTGQDELIGVSTIKVLACISTISLAILTAFNLVTNSGNARNAWRSLNASLMLYNAGAISIEQLIEQYQKGENMLGNFTFNYGTANSKEGTFAHDISASDAAKKQKEANDSSNAVIVATEKYEEATAAEKQTGDKVLEIEAELKSATTDEERALKQNALDQAKAQWENAKTNLHQATTNLQQAKKVKSDAEEKAEQKQKEADAKKGNN